MLMQAGFVGVGLDKDMDVSTGKSFDLTRSSGFAPCPQGIDKSDGYCFLVKYHVDYLC